MYDWGGNPILRECGKHKRWHSPRQPRTAAGEGQGAHCSCRVTSPLLQLQPQSTGGPSLPGLLLPTLLLRHKGSSIGGRTAPLRLQLIIGAAAGLWVQQAGGGGGKSCTKKSLRINFPLESTSPWGQEARQGCRWRRGRCGCASRCTAVANPHLQNYLHRTTHFYTLHSDQHTHALHRNIGRRDKMLPVTVATM